MMMMSVAFSGMLKKDKIIWSKPRRKSWCEEMVKVTFTLNDWFDNFRMSQSTFMYICNVVSKRKIT